VEDEARRVGLAVITNLSGHGVGRKLHEEPADIHGHFEPGDRRRFKDGVVLTVEPFLTTGL
jgi:methionyl aminopeptidase